MRGVGSGSGGWREWCDTVGDTLLEVHPLCLGGLEDLDGHLSRRKRSSVCLHAHWRGAEHSYGLRPMEHM